MERKCVSSNIPRKSSVQIHKRVSFEEATGNCYTYDDGSKYCRVLSVVDYEGQSTEGSYIDN